MQANCKTNYLNGTFGEGFVDKFEGVELGSCDYMSVVLSNGIEASVYHEGEDGWQGDWMKIFFDNNQFVFCDISGRFLENTSKYSVKCSQPHHYF